MTPTDSYRPPSIDPRATHHDADEGALFFLRAAEEAAAEVLEGRKGIVQKPRDQ